MEWAEKLQGREPTFDQRQLVNHIETATGQARRTRADRSNTYHFVAGLIIGLVIGVGLAAVVVR